MIEAQHLVNSVEIPTSSEVAIEKALLSNIHASSSAGVDENFRSSLVNEDQDVPFLSNENIRSVCSLCYTSLRHRHFKSDIQRLPSCLASCTRLVRY